MKTLKDALKIENYIQRPLYDTQRTINKMGHKNYNQYGNDDRLDWLTTWADIYNSITDIINKQELDKKN